MKIAMIDSFWATAEAAAYLIVPIIVVYLTMSLIAELILGKGRG